MNMFQNVRFIRNAKNRGVKGSLGQFLNDNIFIRHLGMSCAVDL